MARKPIIAALLLVGLGAALGTTVFRDDIAQATGLAAPPSSVVVVNSPTQAVPVTVSPTFVINGGGSVTCSTNVEVCDLGFQAHATALSVAMTSGVSRLVFGDFNPPPGGVTGVFIGPASGGSSQFVISLNSVMSFDGVKCQGAADDECKVGWVGK